MPNGSLLVYHAGLVAAMGKLPFKPAPPGAPAPGQGTVKTMPVPVVSSSLGETLPLGSDAIHKAIAAIPFIGSKAGAGVVPFPALTVQQYVSLRADLAATPERWTETLRKYGVPSEASRRALGAAFLAAGDGGAVTMRHLVRATRRELQKMGKSVGAAEFGEYAGMLDG